MTHFCQARGPDKDLGANDPRAPVSHEPCITLSGGRITLGPSFYFGDPVFLIPSVNTGTLKDRKTKTEVERCYTKNMKEKGVKREEQD